MKTNVPKAPAKSSPLAELLDEFRAARVRALLGEPETSDDELISESTAAKDADSDDVTSRDVDSDCGEADGHSPRDAATAITTASSGMTPTYSDDISQAPSSSSTQNQLNADALTADFADFACTSAGIIMNIADTDLQFEHLRDLDQIGPEPEASDEAAFARLIRKQLDPEQEQRIVEPTNVHTSQRSVLGVHWHPEFVDPALIRRRVDSMFPNSELELLVPTQHNVVTHFGEWAGVEIDCYEPAFREKVQLLFHFHGSRAPDEDSVFSRMLKHTYDYRSRQLWEFLDTLLEPAFSDRIDEAVRETQVVSDIVEFVQIHVRRLRTLIDRNMSTIPSECLRNKILRDYFDLLRDHYPDPVIDRVQVLLRAVKKVVKREFSLDYFYEARQFIEEGRALGAGIVIPHPEQFWPVLLAEYDIDGIEVWNPQSYRYTQFLIENVTRENRRLHKSNRPVLITMGDDCHMGEKVKDPRYQDKAKAAREIGVQPPWDEPRIAAMLNASGMNRADVIRQYTDRLKQS
ncbi:MAG: hypothetical protein ACOC0P_02265 [Planctomycetota bacterium]